MTNQTLRKGLMGLALIALAVVLVLLGATFLPSNDTALSASASTQAPTAKTAHSLTAVATGCKQGNRVRAPRLQHDPLKVLLRGILI